MSNSILPRILAHAFGGPRLRCTTGPRIPENGPRVLLWLSACSCRRRHRQRGCGKSDATVIVVGDEQEDDEGSKEVACKRAPAIADPMSIPTTLESTLRAYLLRVLFALFCSHPPHGIRKVHNYDKLERIAACSSSKGSDIDI